ncbi:MAG: PIN domain-containing protein [Magnetospirillum sp. WYHS-4]
MTAPTLNLCLDLNVWCAAFLADRKGLDGTATQTLVRMVRTGQVGEMPVQLIISWGMLTRLRKVMEVDWGISRATVDPVIEAIAGYARTGAAGTAPYLTLGGTGLMPIRDPEDAHVLDTALAGRSHLLVTANFDDFVTAKGRVLESGKIAIVETAAAKLVVAHPFRAVAWLRQGIFPEAEMVERLLEL